MVQQALDAGHRRLVLVNRELWRRGDEIAFSGMMDEVHAAGLERGAIAVRNTPVDHNAMAATVRGWFDELEPPLAYLCREPHCAQAVLRVAEQRNLRVPGDVFVVYDGTGTFDTTEPLRGAASVRCRMSLKKKYALIGQMLARMATGSTAPPDRIVIPVTPHPRQTAT